MSDTHWEWSFGDNLFVYKILLLFHKNQYMQVHKMTMYMNLVQTSSKLKRTPPIGAPNATLTPAAAAAERIW